MSTEFLEDVGKEFLPDDLEQLDAYIVLLKTVQEEIAEATEKLKEMGVRERLLSREQIPELLLSRGLSEVKLVDGQKVTVTEKVACSVPKNPVNKSIVLKWLVAQGGKP